MSCAASLTGPYCAACGQPVVGRHSLRSLAAGLFGRVLNLEAGLLHTARLLTFRPGVVVREYLAGRTAPYTHPAGYLLVAFAAFALTAAVFGGAIGGTDGSNRVFTALLVPFVAGVSRLAFLRAGLNYAEHLILSMYLIGHAAFLLAAVQLVVPVTPSALLPALAALALAGALAYLAWGYARVFEHRPLAAAAAGVFSLLAGAVIWLFAVAAIVQAFRR